MENALSLLRDGKQVYFMFLPDGEDPDTFVRTNGKEVFLDNGLRMPLSEFLFSSISNQVDLQSFEDQPGYLLN